MGNNFSQNDPKPGFVFIETGLPITVGSFLLGCVVADPANPTDYFRPSKNVDAFRDYMLEISETSYNAFVKKNKDQSLNAKVGELLGMGADTSAEQAQRVKSGLVRTRTLMQHEDIKDMLMRSPAKDDIVKLMHKYDGRGFLVVGFKSAVKGKISRISSTTDEILVHMDLPMSAAVAGASHGTVQLPAEKVDPTIKYSKRKGELEERSSTMNGEHIFAVRYRALRLEDGTVTVRKEARLQAEIEIDIDWMSAVQAGPGPLVKVGEGRKFAVGFESSADEFVLSEDIIEKEIGGLQGGKELKFVY